MLMLASCVTVFKGKPLSSTLVWYCLLGCKKVALTSTDETPKV